MVNWNLSLFLLLAIILLFIPVSLSLVLNIGSSSKSGPYFFLREIPVDRPMCTDQSRKRFMIFRAVGSLIPVSIYLFLLSWIPLPDALASSNLTTTALSRLVVLGTIILGLLSGFGAINNAWAFFPLFFRNRYESLTVYSFISLTTSYMTGL